MNNKIQLSSQIVHRVQEALDHESPRGMIMLVLSWIDHMLEQKLRAEFAAGNRKARESLYTLGGAFSSLSSKIAVAYCAGWLDSDLFHDLSLLRKVRNGFAHELAPCSPDAKEIREQLEDLKTPYRIYSDWGEIRAAEIENGVILYSGEKPEEAQGDLTLPGTFALKMGVPAVIGVLADALQIEIEEAEDNRSAPSENGSQSGKGESLAPPPRTTVQAGPHTA